MRIKMDWKERYSSFKKGDRVKLIEDPVWKNELKERFMSLGYLKDGIYTIRTIFGDGAISIEISPENSGMMTPKEFLRKV